MTKKPTQHKVKATIQADVEITIDADHHLEAKEELKTHLTKELGLKKVSINFPYRQSRARFLPLTPNKISIPHWALSNR